MAPCGAAALLSIHGRTCPSSYWAAPLQLMHFLYFLFCSSCFTGAPSYSIVLDARTSSPRLKAHKHFTLCKPGAYRLLLGITHCISLMRVPTNAIKQSNS